MGYSCRQMSAALAICTLVGTGWHLTPGRGLRYPWFFRLALLCERCKLGLHRLECLHINERSRIPLLFTRSILGQREFLRMRCWGRPINMYLQLSSDILTYQYVLAAGHQEAEFLHYQYVLAAGSKRLSSDIIIMYLQLANKKRSSNILTYQYVYAADQQEAELWHCQYVLAARQQEAELWHSNLSICTCSWHMANKRLSSDTLAY